MIPDSWMKGPLMWSALLLTLLAILLAFVWELATDQAEQRIRAEQSTQHHIEYAEDRIDKKCLSLEAIPMRDCIYEEIESARDHARANQDLKAQEQMAFFTKIMGGTAIAGLMVVCTYFWEEELKSVWMIVDTNRPPENTLNC